MNDDPTTVLVVDDHPEFLRMTQTALTKRGFRVLVAGSAEEAVEVVAEHGNILDVVVMDVVLPDTWGPQVVFEQALVRPDVKVIYVSGYTKKDRVLRASTKGQDAPFLEKPFEMEELAALIRELLDGNEPLRPRE